MQRPDALTPAQAQAALLLRRWDRIGIGVRCAYNPQRPEVLQHYLQAGRRLSSLQPQIEALIQRRMLDLLLQTAADAALPWSWRAMCLEHAAWPVARLTSLWRTGAGAALQSTAQLESRIRCAAEQLGLPSRAAP
jgi:hypothetical protein